MYKSGIVSVGTVDWVELDPTIDIGYISVYSSAGDFYLQCKQKNAYGDSIKVFQNASFGDCVGATNARIKSLAGTINVSYYISDNK